MKLQDKLEKWVFNTFLIEIIYIFMILQLIGGTVLLDCFGYNNVVVKSHRKPLCKCLNLMQYEATC